MNKLTYITLLLFLPFWACESVPEEQGRPNIILIMADDMGYECLGVNGSTSYQTPVLDKMAAEGVRFTHCYSQPLCTPSRVKIMTGKHNYKNYEHFGYLNPEAKTFGNVAKEAGYATCIVGKWQLNGISGTKRKGWNDEGRAKTFGFDEYSLWQYRYPRTQDDERFARPLIEQNGELLERDSSAYGPDIFTDYMLDFIERNQDTNFMVYFPMALVHNPFVPSPDSPEWDYPLSRFDKDTTYFKDMMAYTDKIVGRINDKLDELGLRENTILIFTGDNGTNKRIISQTVSGPIKGMKGHPVDAGTRVPMIVSWPSGIKNPKVFDGMTDFSDFYPSLAEAMEVDIAADSIDGKSFLPMLKGEAFEEKEFVTIHYDPQWGKNSDYRCRFVRNQEYKLYHDGRYYHIPSDPEEKNDLSKKNLQSAANQLKLRMYEEMAKHPKFIVYKGGR